MTTLPEFLLARIAEDEADVSRQRRERRFATAGMVGYVSEPRVRRVLVDCEAKRRIVEIHRLSDHPIRTWANCSTCGACPWKPCPTLRALALPYTEHSDYREEWKP